MSENEARLEAEQILALCGRLYQLSIGDRQTIVEVLTRDLLAASSRRGPETHPLADIAAPRVEPPILSLRRSLRLC